MMTESATRECLLDAEGLAARLEAMAIGMAALIDDPAAAAIVGIRTRGATIAGRIAKILAEREGWNLPVGSLDITLYRDDLSQLAENPLVRHTELPFDIANRAILLVDDVLYTGRTVRAALDELVDFGRPSAIRLCVLVDRGHRELPIHADLTAMEVETTPDQVVKVCLQEDDGKDCVLLGTL